MSSSFWRRLFSAGWMVSSLFDGSVADSRGFRLSVAAFDAQCAILDQRIGCGVAPLRQVAAERVARDAHARSRLASRPGRNESRANPDPSCGIWPRFMASTNAATGRCD